jgi:dipeptidyl aminopeptidase/acylaminoacyl peptidase
MSTVTIAPYGAWASPVTTDLLTAESVRLGSIALEAGCAWWLEGRPEEGGRNVLVVEDQDSVRDVTPAPFNVRSRVHEYGGGAFVVSGREVWFVHDADQRVYHQRLGEVSAPLTAPGPSRYADLALDRARRRLVCVRETHAAAVPEPINELVAVSLIDGAVRVLATGHDFYSSPRVSPDGARVAWLTWDHPDMPWDAAALWFADVGPQGELSPPRRVDLGDRASAFQPAWSPDGVLHVVCDAGDWWNLHALDGDGRLRCVHRVEAEAGLPQWQFAMSTYGFPDARRIVSARCEAGRWRLACIDRASGAARELDTGLDEIEAVVAGNGQVLLLAGSPTQASSVVRIDLASGAQTVLRESATLGTDPGYVSRPEAFSFATGSGATAHAFRYPPTNPEFRAPAGERPPLLVIGHGGPTGATSTVLRPAIQYWTTRGFAVCDVNYRGSTGYGRAYREALYGEWGVVDVEDCVNAARHLVDAGLADPSRLAIRGSSAGGYTTLAALVFHRTFGAGASYYGISELEALARDTHKFEARYLDRLVGPYPARADLYRARSPIHHVERLDCPVIFFQGLEDAVVPPSQAQMMVAALREKGLPVAYLTFEGEQHGFRRAQTIRRTLEAELAFYGRIFGFEPADSLEPLQIDNL